MLILLNVQRKPSRKLFWLSLRLFASFAALPAQAEAQDVQASPSELSPGPEFQVAAPAPEAGPACEAASAPALPSSLLAPSSPLDAARRREEALRAQASLIAQGLRDARTLNRELGPTGLAKTVMFAGMGATAFGAALFVIGGMSAILPHGTSGPDGDMMRGSAIMHGVGGVALLTGFVLLRRQQQKQLYRAEELQLRRELHGLRQQLRDTRREVQKLEAHELGGFLAPSAAFDRHGARLALRFSF